MPHGYGAGAKAEAQGYNVTAWLGLGAMYAKGRLAAVPLIIKIKDVYWVALLQAALSGCCDLALPCRLHYSLRLCGGLFGNLSRCKKLNDFIKS